MQRSLECVAAEIFLAWLGRRLGVDLPLVLRDDGFFGQADGGQMDGEQVSIAVYPLFDLDADAAWTRRRDAIATQLWQDARLPLTLWVPPETDLPAADRTEFVRRVVETSAALPLGGRGQVEFPVSLTLRKQSDEASYVHVIGGLAPLWARLTGRAYGQYLLDTTAIHRLPEAEQRVTDLLEWIALVGNGMKAGASSEIKAEDVWTVSRPARADGVTIVGAAPSLDPSNGTAVRKALRAGLRAASERPAPETARRAVVFLGAFRSMQDESATIALRSCDPALYAPFDTVALVADGICKSLIGPRQAGR